MKKDWIYYGVFFSDNTKRSILNFAKKCLSDNNMEIPDDWKIYCDHMTLVFNNGSKEAQEDADYYEKWGLGQSVSLWITHIGYSDRAIALQVDYKTANKVSHITVAVAPDAKPVESNDITHWVKNNEAFYATGIVKKIGNPNK